MRWLRVRRPWSLAVLVPVVVVVCWVGVARHAFADHESTNVLTFAAVGSAAPGATGSGRIEYEGGRDAATRWTATFQFEGLQSGAPYSVVVEGRFGADESAAAAEITELCSFSTAADGAGTCWHYFVELQRLATVELRFPDARGVSVLQATRAGDAPGAIESVPNLLSPSPTPSPAATPIPSPTS